MNFEKTDNFLDGASLELQQHWHLQSETFALTNHHLEHYLIYIMLIIQNFRIRGTMVGRVQLFKHTTGVYV